MVFFCHFISFSFLVISTSLVFQAKKLIFTCWKRYLKQMIDIYLKISLILVLSVKKINKSITIRLYSNSHKCVFESLVFLHCIQYLPLARRSLLPSCGTFRKSIKQDDVFLCLWWWELHLKWPVHVNHVHHQYIFSLKHSCLWCIQTMGKTIRIFYLWHFLRILFVF